MVKAENNALQLGVKTTESLLPEKPAAAWGDLKASGRLPRTALSFLEGISVVSDDKSLAQRAPLNGSCALLDEPAKGESCPVSLTGSVASFSVRLLVSSS